MAQPKGRAPGWGKETVLRELESGLSITEISAKYATEASPNTLRSEVYKWQAEDEQFAADYSAIVGPENQRRRGMSDPGLKPENANWRIEFCEALFATGNRLLAANVTPYEYTTIVKKLDEGDPVHYDKEFAEMVRLTQLRLCAKVEEVVTNAVFDVDVPKRDRAMIGLKVLERQDPKRWGKQVEMIHSGTIKHEASAPALPREQRLAALASELKRFMLPANTETQPPAIEDVVDAQVLETVPVVSAHS